MNIIITHVPNPDRKIFNLENNDIDLDLYKVILMSKGSIKEMSVHSNQLYVEKYANLKWGVLITEICNTIADYRPYTISNQTLTEKEIQSQAEQLYKETLEGLEYLESDLNNAISQRQ